MVGPVLKSLAVAWRQRYLNSQSLIFFVTSRCNARCEFCLYYEQVNNPTEKKLELTVDEVEQVAKNYGPLHYLALSGGEVFVRNDISALVQAFVDHCGVSVVDIPSNFFFKEAMIGFLEDFLPKNPNVIVDLQMSIDHLYEKHDEMRKVKGLFDKAIETYKAVEELKKRHSNLRLKVNIVYLEQNKKDLHEICVKLNELIDYDRIQLTYPNKIIEQKSVSEHLHYQEFVKAEQKLMESSKNKKDLYSMGMKAVKPIYHRLLGASIKASVNTGAYCNAGQHILVINEKGDVFPCEPLWQSVGSLRENNYDINKVLSGETYAHFRKKHLGENKCNCTWGCAYTSEISTNKKYIAELGKNAWKQLL